MEGLNAIQVHICRDRPSWACLDWTQAWVFFADHYNSFWYDPVCNPFKIKVQSCQTFDILFSVRLSVRTLSYSGPESRRGRHILLRRNEGRLVLWKQWNILHYKRPIFADHQLVPNHRLLPRVGRRRRYAHVCRHIHGSLPSHRWRSGNSIFLSPRSVSLS